MSSQAGVLRLEMTESLTLAQYCRLNTLDGTCTSQSRMSLEHSTDAMNNNAVLLHVIMFPFRPITITKSRFIHPFNLDALVEVLKALILRQMMTKTLHCVLMFNGTMQKRWPIIYNIIHNRVTSLNCNDVIR